MLDHLFTNLLHPAVQFWLANSFIAWGLAALGTLHG